MARCFRATSTMTRQGDKVKPTAKTLLEAERFLGHVKKARGKSGCHLWIGGRKGGPCGQRYGAFRVGSRIKGGRRRLELAHRWAYQQSGRKLKKGLVIDHICNNFLCVNPAHLRQVTQRENLRAAREA